MKILTLKQVETAYDGVYSDMAILAVIFNHEIVEVEDVWRWKENTLMSHLSDNFPAYPYYKMFPRSVTPSRHKLDYNQLHIDQFDKKFTVEEKMKFMMQIGYSLSGFGELFGQHEASDFNLPGARKTHKPGQDKDTYVETVIDYMIRVHKGKVLKL